MHTNLSLLPQRLLLLVVTVLLVACKGSHPASFSDSKSPAHQHTNTPARQRYLPAPDEGWYVLYSRNNYPVSDFLTDKERHLPSLLRLRSGKERKGYMTDEDVLSLVGYPLYTKSGRAGQNTDAGEWDYTEWVYPNFYVMFRENDSLFNRQRVGFGEAPTAASKVGHSLTFTLAEIR